MGGRTAAIIIKKSLASIFFFFSFLSFPISLARGFSLPKIPSTAYSIAPPESAVQTQISRKNWHYMVPFEVKNKTDIEKLIQSESQGVNISRPDSNRRISDGVLQFNRGPSDILGSRTCSDMEARFGFFGSPIQPADAIHMADLMVTNGFLSRWTCAGITALL
jgi:hypothetical protein